MAAKSFMLVSVAMLAACGSTNSDEGGATQRQQIGQVWKYEAKTDPATGKATPLAYLGSANSVKTMTAPDTFAVILLQKMRNGETGVTVKAVGAPFTCDLSSCAVEASMDGGAPKKWQGRMTETKDGISIPPPQNAFEAIRDSKSVKVKIDLGTEGAQEFTFNTAGFAWPKP
ncbi:MAG: hypothetical protein ACO1NM_03560 [Sphingobium phenoxybenzoativorans]|uniref:hypothetical protein n=1 Tax=Sphingobium phenoxybenzoativorans TaxID=1592790 RepID=UPI000871EEDF|nr:hypothetical protein [Sphingobium phenoxybenzoativorans]